jgi:hypothetical protein
LGERIDTDKLLDEAAVQRCLELLAIYRGQECSPTGTQWAFLCDCTGRLLVNQLLRFDYLIADFHWICSHLRLKPDACRTLIALLTPIGLAGYQLPLSARSSQSTLRILSYTRGFQRAGIAFTSLN